MADRIRIRQLSSMKRSITRTASIFSDWLEKLKKPKKTEETFSLYNFVKVYDGFRFLIGQFWWFSHPRTRFLPPRSLTFVSKETPEFLRNFFLCKYLGMESLQSKSSDKVIKTLQHLSSWRFSRLIWEKRFSAVTQLEISRRAFPRKIELFFSRLVLLWFLVEWIKLVVWHCSAHVNVWFSFEHMINNTFKSCGVFIFFWKLFSKARYKFNVKNFLLIVSAASWIFILSFPLLELSFLVLKNKTSFESNC